MVVVTVVFGFLASLDVARDLSKAYGRRLRRRYAAEQRDYREWAAWLKEMQL